MVPHLRRPRPTSLPTSTPSNGKSLKPTQDVSVSRANIGMIVAFIVLVQQGIRMGHELSTKCVKPFSQVHPSLQDFKASSAISNSYNRDNNNIASTKPFAINLRRLDTGPLTPFYPTNEIYNGSQRVFPTWELPFPCVPVDFTVSRSAIQEGFIYVKEFKTGSSTLAGVAMRIAHNEARKLLADPNTTKVCQARFLHLRARRFESRSLTKSFIWSIIREPTQRAVSKFFHFAVSRNKTQPNLESLQAYFRDSRQYIYDDQYYLKSLSLHGFNPRDATILPQVVDSILNEYNFIGITERMDESLVVLQMLLGLDTGDILYLSSKASGSYEWFPLKQSCIYIQPTYVSPAMKEWFHSDEWRNYVWGDVMLYKAVNHSLDMTIESLGRDKVARQLARFKWAQKEAYRRCADTTVFLCSLDGEHNDGKDCLWMDAGCGYQCLDQLAEELPYLQEFAALPE